MRENSHGCEICLQAPERIEAGNSYRAHDLAARPSVPLEDKIEGEEAEAENVSDILAEQAAADVSKSRLMEQIQALRRADQLQRDHLARAAAYNPPTREEKLAFWKQAGVPERDLKFLGDHPVMIDHDAINTAD